MFGEPTRVVQRDEMLKQKWNELQACGGGVMSAPARPGMDREVYRVITKDLIRDIVIPKQDPSGRSMIISGDEFDRLKQASKFLTPADRDALRKQREEDKINEEDAANARRAELKSYDAKRKQQAKLTDLEEEARDKAEHLLQRAHELRLEQEDDIKKLNGYILESKCHAIRDAQVLEKEQVQKEMCAEERRLDGMMEADRNNALKIQEEIENRRRQESYLRALQILDQIKEREKQKLLELEAKDQENMSMQKFLHNLMLEEKEKLEKKRDEQNELRVVLNKANEDLVSRKQGAKEQERLIDLKVLEFQRAKAEREAAFEAEQKRIKADKEKEVARLRALQQRAQDEQAERDALRAKRAQEDAERQWRSKEQMEAKKKADTEALMARARVEQQELKEHLLSVEAARDRAEFERILRAQKELIEKDKLADEERHHQRKDHAVELKKQIKAREGVKINERNAFFAEAIKSKEEARLRHQKLEQHKAKKLSELRDLGIPDKYLSEVERKLERPQHLAT